MTTDEEFQQEWPTPEANTHRRLLDLLDGWWNLTHDRYNDDQVPGEVEAIDDLYLAAGNLFVNEDGQTPIDPEVIKRFLIEKVVALVVDGPKKEGST